MTAYVYLVFSIFF